ncbi:hypothetical protein VTK73DRAFT_1560 [Phialemonium thermophilum]|uniref:Dol-P-Man:Man(5)GlcNAc(2)-PP-Dol alpha-1,3-mannosyltransferase n=1 Tax=Phialemonium thermophilum TaxID=223376 RepID=A0ABR3X9P3_9PEZI
MAQVMASARPPMHIHVLKLALDLASGRNALARAIPPLLVLADAFLCALIIWKVPYTEIDWTAYMQQISQYVSGEHDYTKIEGGTGPLVYPAAHVYIYTGLYYITSEGRDIFLAQQLFAVLYIATLILVMTCYWRAKAPPYIFPLLILSKRLHSIFVLRCFNDCFAVFFLWLSIFFFQRRSWSLGAVAFSWGLGIKMSLLLALPAVGVVLFLGRGFRPALRLAILMAQMQVAIALPFLRENPWGYLARAFELSRQFFFKWTVNWRFVGEDVFLSRPFSAILLVLHASTLVLFATTRWLRPAGKSARQIILAVLSRGEPFSREEEGAIKWSITPEFILTTVLTANVIGLLFARSLHYQFYSYLAWSTPFLLWRSGMHPVLQYLVWFLQEWAWNVFPSTAFSSGVVVSVLAVTVGCVWRATAEKSPSRVAETDTADRKTR